jgi:hypothetical protein
VVNSDLLCSIGRPDVAVGDLAPIFHMLGIPGTNLGSVADYYVSSLSSPQALHANSGIVLQKGYFRILPLFSTAFPGPPFEPA